MEVATENSYAEIIKCLHKGGADVNETDKFGISLLMKATSINNKEVCFTLLELKADPNAQDVHGCTALMCAAFRGYKEIVSYLLEANADTTMCSLSGESAIDMASDQEIIKLLSPYNINGRLLEACKNNDIVTAKELLDSGANPNNKPRGRDSALCYATENGNLQLVKLLVKHGANINI